MLKKAILFSSITLFLLSCQNEKKEEIIVENVFDEATMRKADSLSQSLIITDGHVDLPYWLKERGINIINKENGQIIINGNEGDFDYERAKKGGLDAPFMSIYIPASYQDTTGAKALADSLIDMVESIASTFPEQFAMAYTPADVEKNFKEGKISLPLGMENGAPIGDSLSNIKYFFDRGIRYITLTHSKDNLISDSSYDTARTHNGLSAFGKEAVREMNKVGIMVDVSHISDSAFYDVMEVTNKPVIASHSSCRHFTPGFERNMSDDLIKALAKNGGVIQINFGSSFLDSASHNNRNANNEKLGKLLKERNLKAGDPQAKAVIDQFNKENPFLFTDVSRAADHIDHVVKLVGIDYVGLGSDYDGVGDTLPDELKDVSQFPNLIAVLLERGYSDEDIAKICYKNVFRVWNQVLDNATQESKDTVAL